MLALKELAIASKERAGKGSTAESAENKLIHMFKKGKGDEEEEDSRAFGRRKISLGRFV